jgi:endonuclease/exonuclease/phosphatase family metal-dependent hydrolase
MKTDNPGIIRRFFSSIFLLLNLCAVVWLVLCLLASFTNPAEVEYIALFSLSTPFAILANLVFIIFWLFSSHKWRAILSILAIGGCYKVVLTIVGFNFFGPNDMKQRGNTIKIMSWNAHGMGIFEKPKPKDFDKNILEYLDRENADILCLPEYSLSKDNIMKPFADKIIRNGDYIDYRFQPDNSLNNKVYIGTAVFSRYPFKNYESHRLTDFIYMMQGDVQLPGNNMLRVFFVHLTTFGLSDKDKAYIDEAKKRNTEVKDDLTRSKTFIGKFNNAFAKRAKEAGLAASIIAKSPYPVFICGDFNDLPGSYTYTTMRSKRNDAFLDKGRGFGRTYNHILPTLRIDHMFYDTTGLRLLGFECPSTTLSDHNPLIANFEIIGKPQS